jgi:hypothetical protein
MLMMICLTTSVGALRSIKRLWILRVVSLYILFSLPVNCILPHLVHVPGLAALTTRCLAGGDLEVLGWKTHRSLHAQLLGLGTVDELAAHFLERRNFARGEGDADLVDLGLVDLRRLLWVLERHVGGGSEGFGWSR